ncbi:MAG: hypothetical protein ACP5FK_09370 [bacterium]
MIFQYKPVRPLIVTSVFIAVAVFLGYLMRNDNILFKLAMGIVFIIALINLVFRIAYVRIEIKDNKMHYHYLSLIRNINKTLTRDDIDQIYLDQVAYHRGVTSNQLVLVTKQKKKLIIHPFYSPTVDIELLEQKIYQMPTAQEIEEETEEDERTEIEKTPLHQKVWMFVEMSVKCPYCDGAVNINGPYTEFICPNCQSVIDFNPQKWTDMFEDIREEVVEEIEPGHGTKSTVMGVFDARMFYGRMVPYCKQCKQDFEIEQELIDQKFIKCSNCGKKTSLHPPHPGLNR